MNTFIAAIGSCLTLLPALAQETFPWHCSDAASRTAYRISTPFEACDLSVTLPLTRGGQPVALLDPESPDALLPVFFGTNGASFLLRGKAGPAHPRFVIAYRGAQASSKALEAPPTSSDFSQTVLNRPWDFEDGTQCGISSWGNGPNHLGLVTVTNGWLKIPVRNTDPYLIFGDMFGKPDSPRCLKIDSAAYRYLELRLRQSCPDAEWEFFVTDRDGRYKSFKFAVTGTAAQTFRFDLRALFPDFWDGRTFRALRIDTTNDRTNILAELDYVRILPSPPTVTAGPVFTREAADARGHITGIKAALPRSVTAGASQPARVKTSGADKNSTVIWSFATTGSSMAIEGTAAGFALPVLTRAGTCAWTLGVSDDLGGPLHAATGQLRVEPAPLASYALVPEKEYIDLSTPRVSLSVFGLDPFGNRQPVNIRRPQWNASEHARLSEGSLKGFPAQAVITCPSNAPATYTVTLSDSEGRRGTTAVTTVAYRKGTVRAAPSGYLSTPSGELVFPAGGLYANWPHRLNPDGSISGSLDLFPCGPKPYAEGFPWTPKTEAAVNAYLKHCSERGINCLRLMLRNMDLVGRVDAVQLQAVFHLFDLARPYGMRFNVALFEDYDKPPYVSQAILEKIVLPQYAPDSLAKLPPHRARFLLRKDTLSPAALRYTDADAIACQKDYLRELIPALAAREEVLCYELENEMVFPPMSWCQTMADFIRTIDPHTLILGNPGPHDWPEPLRWRDSGCDLFSFHPYNDGEKQADHGAIVYLRSKFAAQSRLPLYTGEGGINQNRWQRGVKQLPPEASARGARDQIWMSACCGAAGCLYWTLSHDLEAREFASVGTAFQALGLDLLTLKRQRAAVALALPANQRDPNAAALAMRLLSLGVDFDTVSTNEAASYPVKIDPSSRFPENLTLPATVAAPAAGWQIATLVSDKSDQALLYLRNIAGGVVDLGTPPRPCYVRGVQPAEAAFTLRSAWRTVTVFDLDTREAKRVAPDASRRVSLGVSSHDYLVSLRQ